LRPADLYIDSVQAGDIEKIETEDDDYTADGLVAAAAAAAAAESTATGGGDYGDVDGGGLSLARNRPFTLYRVPNSAVLSLTITKAIGGLSLAHNRPIT
jgi:hypothetical protein